MRQPEYLHEVRDADNVSRILGWMKMTDETLRCGNVYVFHPGSLVWLADWRKWPPTNEPERVTLVQLEVHAVRDIGGLHNEWLAFRAKASDLPSLRKVCGFVENTVP